MYLNSLSLIYVRFKSENIVTLVTIGYIVGMHIENCLWAQVAVLDIYILDYIALFGTGYAGIVFG